MNLNQKYTVFISSTYEDLRELRERASYAVLQIGHIPVGMEMFRASDVKSWQLITQNIDRSDYYVVIIARRYGSTIDGISVTEMEYDYAVKNGVPTLAFVLDQSASWPLDRIEDTPEAKRALERFIEKVRSKQIDFWKDEADLQTKIAMALINEMSANPRPGWVRGSELVSPHVADELSRLSSENNALRLQVQQAKKSELLFETVKALVWFNPKNLEMSFSATLLLDIDGNLPVTISWNKCAAALDISDHTEFAQMRSGLNIDADKENNIDARYNRVIISGPGQCEVTGREQLPNEEIFKHELLRLRIVFAFAMSSKVVAVEVPLKREPATEGRHPVWSQSYLTSDVLYHDVP